MKTEVKKGDTVIYAGLLPSLDYGTIGSVKEIIGDQCVVVYPQNESFVDLGNGKFKPKSGPAKVYSHSCHVSMVSKHP